MTAFNPIEAERLAEEFAEDDERATKAPWQHEQTLHGNGEVHCDIIRTVEDSISIAFDGDGGDADFHEDDASAIARLRNNARSASEQLRAACAEVDRLRAKVSDMRSGRLRIESDRDRLAARVKELERLAGEACDIATQSSYAVSHPPERTSRIKRITAIRAALKGGSK